MLLIASALFLGIAGVVQLLLEGLAHFGGVGPYARIFRIDCERVLSAFSHSRPLAASEGLIRLIEEALDLTLKSFTCHAPRSCRSRVRLSIDATP